jgi:hypothetical protein
MISFQSNIVGGVVLLRSAIQSPDYSPGASGWTINQDGSVEFNNAVIRGELVVTGTSNGSITISNEEISPGDFEPTIALMPPEVVGFAGYNDGRAPAIIQALESDSGTQNSATTSIRIESPTPRSSFATAQPYMAITSGSYDASSRGLFFFGYPTDPSQVDFQIAVNVMDIFNLTRILRSTAGAALRIALQADGNNSRLEITTSGQMTWGDGSGAGDTNLFRSSANNLRTNDSLTVDGFSSIRTKVAQAALTATSAAVTAETVVITLPSATYAANRAYKATLEAGITTTGAAVYGDIRLKKTNTAGQTLGEYFRFPAPTTTTVYPAHGTRIFTTGASAVTAALVITLQVPAGTVAMFASAGSPSLITIDDCGLDSDYPSMPVLV